MRWPGLDSRLSDSLVASALNNPSSGSVSYTITVQNLTGYLNAGSNGINHGRGTVFHTFLMSQLIFYVTGIAIDGVVRLLTVTMQDH
jgi:hypothetical protein